jgi:hypothetical protein
MGGVTSFIGSVRWRVAAYKCPMALPLFFVLPSAFIRALAFSPTWLSCHLVRARSLER